MTKNVAHFSDLKLLEGISTGRVVVVGPSDRKEREARWSEFEAKQARKLQSSSDQSRSRSIFTDVFVNVDASLKKSIGRLEWNSKRVRNQQLARHLFISTLAKQALGDDAMVRKFMTSKHPMLKASPESCLDTEWGARQVEELLHGMMHGLPA